MLDFAWAVRCLRRWYLQLDSLEVLFHCCIVAPLDIAVKQATVVPFEDLLKLYCYHMLNPKSTGVVPV